MFVFGQASRNTGAAKIELGVGVNPLEERRIFVHLPARCGDVQLSVPDVSAS